MLCKTCGSKLKQKHNTKETINSNKKVKLLKSSINNTLSNDSYGNIVRSVLTNVCWDPTELDNNGKKILYYTYNACTILERNVDFNDGDWTDNEKIL